SATRRQSVSDVPPGGKPVTILTTSSAGLGWALSERHGKERASEARPEARRNSRRLRSMNNPPALRSGDSGRIAGLRQDAPLRAATASAMVAAHRGPVAQLDRALPSEGRGREFESRRVRQLRTKPRNFGVGVF